MDVHIWLLAVVALSSGCIEAAEPPARSQPQSGRTSPRRGASREAPPHFVQAASGAVDEVVKAAAQQARSDGETLVVYVGAPWCEPCEAFHKAVEAGETNAELAGIRFLEFNADLDGERLVAAGYDGRLIPRFALPNEDGRFSGRKIEGGIKGTGAVHNILQRLVPMLEAAAR